MITYRFDRNGLNRVQRRSLGDVLGVLTSEFSYGADVLELSATRLVVCNENLCDRTPETTTVEGDVEEMRALVRTTEAYLLLVDEKHDRTWLNAPAGTKAPPRVILTNAAEAIAHLPVGMADFPNFVALCAGLELQDGEETDALERFHHDEVRLLVHFNVDLKRPILELARAFNEDPETVDNLVGHDINIGDIMAVIDLVRTERPGTCPLALARELKAGIPIYPRDYGWSV